MRKQASILTNQVRGGEDEGEGVPIRTVDPFQERSDSTI